MRWGESITGQRNLLCKGLGAEGNMEDPGTRLPVKGPRHAHGAIHTCVYVYSYT